MSASSSAPAHPRGGGENFSHRCEFCLSHGSSPRGRGKQLGVGDGQLGRGLIPAGAGKTRGRSKTPCAKPAHPRGGGENAGGLQPAPHVAGSSPRGRGKLRPGRGLGPRGRLIPAGAGKTQCVRTRMCALTAHPRGGGENDTCPSLDIRNTGSSPRGRGKPDRVGAAAGQGGLIPAGAGKTPGRRAQAVGAPAHPRGGGENRRRKRADETTAGSSPRGRGKHRVPPRMRR